MQTGVKFTMDGPSKFARDADPKHLRVGVNSAMVHSGSLAKLLMDKGIIGRVEYYKAIADGMEEEVERYKNELQQMYPGKTINLL